MIYELTKKHAATSSVLPLIILRNVLFYFLIL